ncbi:MAG: M24 family metallopeptidase [Acidimicrobiales bacterium]|nr:M24 family metallopeptidase [Acidimicrobiales bacterium]
MIAGRRKRLWEAMDDAGLDALVLGRPANVAYASGATALWTAGSRPFAPSCVIVGDDIHLLSTWDEGIPDDIPHDHLFGLSWNPAVVAADVAAIPGLADAHRIGTDGTSAGFRRIAERAAPGAELVDARSVLDRTRAVKTAAELSAVRRACCRAGEALDLLRAALTSGTSERDLLSTLAAATAEVGATVITDEVVARRTASGLHHVVTDVPARRGELVALSPTLRVDGYDGTVARTVVVDAEPGEAAAALRARCRAALDEVIARCRPGATGRDLLDTWAGAGGGDLGVPLAHGLGIGAEWPLIGLGVGGADRLDAGMVLAVQGWMHAPEAGGWLERDVVHVTDDGPRTLTREGSA